LKNEEEFVLVEIHIEKKAAHNIRYISGGKDAQLERFAIPIKVLNGRKESSS
jgi:hypothetical protein